MTTFGIDLGTTYSCISYCDDSGHAKVVRNAIGDETTPSVVYFEDAENIAVGRYAKDVAKLYPESVVSLIKREMGTTGSMNSTAASTLRNRCQRLSCGSSRSMPARRPARRSAMS